MPLKLYSFIGDLDEWASKFLEITLLFHGLAPLLNLPSRPSVDVLRATPALNLYDLAFEDINIRVR